MFEVQRKMCKTCIYRKDSPLDLDKLENEVRDKYGGFTSHRVCHHSEDVCCRGFWDRHKDEFPLGQVAQRLDAVNFVHVDTLAKLNKPESRIFDDVSRVDHNAEHSE